MILKIFAIRDRAINSFDRPMFSVSQGQMVRSFQDEANRVAGDNMVNLHPEDYELWSLGSFDTDNGRFESHDPEMIAVAKDLVIKRS